MLLCSDNDTALVLILFRDTDGRMLLDIFDENLHPLSVSSLISFPFFLCELPLCLLRFVSVTYLEVFLP